MLPYAVEAENRDSPASVDLVTEEPGHRIRHPRRSTAAAESIAVRDREERRLPVSALYLTSAFLSFLLVLSERGMNNSLLTFNLARGPTPTPGTLLYGY